jgi:phosphatidylserine decarboxylase
VGSTVVMLFPAPRVRFPSDWVGGRPVRLGEAMGAQEAR